VDARCATADARRRLCAVAVRRAGPYRLRVSEAQLERHGRHPTWTGCVIVRARLSAPPPQRATRRNVHTCQPAMPVYGARGRWQVGAYWAGGRDGGSRWAATHAGAQVRATRLQHALRAHAGCRGMRMAWSRTLRICEATSLHWRAEGSHRAMSRSTARTPREHGVPRSGMEARVRTRFRKRVRVHVLSFRTVRAIGVPARGECEGSASAVRPRRMAAAACCVAAHAG
jgi:hypothetical protein